MHRHTHTVFQPQIKWILIKSAHTHIHFLFRFLAKQICISQQQQQKMFGIFAYLIVVVILAQCSFQCGRIGTHTHTKRASLLQFDVCHVKIRALCRQFKEKTVTILSSLCIEFSVCRANLYLCTRTHTHTKQSLLGTLMVFSVKS